MSQTSALQRALYVSANVAGIAALAVWLGFIALFEHFDATRPTRPDTVARRVIPQNNHGHIVYLTEHEQNDEITLQYAAIGLLLVTTLVLYSYKKCGGVLPQPVKFELFKRRTY